MTDFCDSQVPHFSMQFFHEALESSWEAHYRLVSDDLENIQAALIELVWSLCKSHFEFSSL